MVLQEGSCTCISKEKRGSFGAFGLLACKGISEMEHTDRIPGSVLDVARWDQTSTCVFKWPYLWCVLAYHSAYKSVL